MAIFDSRKHVFWIWKEIRKISAPYVIDFLAAQPWLRETDTTLVVVEIDSYPDRQDLSLDLIKLARKAGCRISLGTDSHGESQLGFIEFGLAAALKKKIDPERILNFMSREDLVNWANKERSLPRGKSVSSIQNVVDR